MKYYIIIGVILTQFLVACNKLDLNPLSEGSSENWYKTKEELTMSTAYLLDISYWDTDLTQVATTFGSYSSEWTDKFTDDWTARATLSDITQNTLTSQTSYVELTWRNSYKCIAAANRIVENLHKAGANVVEQDLRKYEAVAKFARASQYARLIFLYGDVPYYTNTLSIESAFKLAKTSKNTILDSIYKDYDFAALHLFESYASNELAFPTKGAAYAMKARIANYMGDWEVGKNAAQACIDLNKYELYPNYRDLFLSKTRKTVETIFSIPRSVTLNSYLPTPGRTKEPITRIAGGFGNGGPSWDLFCAYLCIDGKPIDESPLFNPHKPFDNRDPRLAASIVPFGSEWLGFIYEPHPDALTVLNLSTGNMQRNLDNLAVDNNTSYNGLTWKKKVDADWLDLITDPDNVVMRYADLLLLYAEAKIELNEIDDAVLEAINKVRARAYGVNYTETAKYPVLTQRDPTELRKVLRIERRMEFAFEGLRYADLIRWKLAEKALNKPIYGLLDPAALRANVVDKGLWFFPSTPTVDEDGVTDFTEMFNRGQIKLLVNRKFDAAKQYLWPIPAKEIMTNKNIKQNPNY